MRPWVSPYSCRRGPSANTTANRAPSCATPRERTPSARPTTHALVDHPVVVGAGRLSPHDRGAGAVRPRGPGKAAPPTAPAARPPPKPAPLSGTGAGEAGASSRRRGARPLPPPPPAREGAGGRRAQAARPGGRRGRQARPGPPSAREGAGGRRGRAQAVPWPAKEDVAERPAGQAPPARSPGQAAGRRAAAATQQAKGGASPRSATREPRTQPPLPIVGGAGPQATRPETGPSIRPAGAGAWRAHRPPTPLARSGQAPRWETQRRISEPTRALPAGRGLNRWRPAARSAGRGPRVGGPGQRVAATACRHPNEGGPPCSCRRGPTQPTRPRGRGRSAPGPGKAAPPTARQPGLPKACPAFGDGSRRGRGFLTAAGARPRPPLPPPPPAERAQGAGEPKPPPGGGQESPSRPPGGEAQPAGGPAPPALGPRPAPTASSPPGWSPYSCRRGPSPHDRGQGPLGPGAREAAPPTARQPGPLPKPAPLSGREPERQGLPHGGGARPRPPRRLRPRPERAQGQESPSRPPGGRGPTSRGTPHRPPSATHDRAQGPPSPVRPAGATPRRGCGRATPESHAAALGPRGRQGPMGGSPSQPLRRHGGKDRVGDARPPPHSRPRAALGSGGPRSQPPPASTQPPLPIVGGAGPQATRPETGPSIRPAGAGAWRALGGTAGPPTPLARSGQAAARGKGPSGRRAAATQQAKGGARLRRPALPAPLRTREPRTQPPLPIVGGAGPQANDQRQGLHPRRHGGKDRVGDARPPPHGRPRAALGSGGPRCPAPPPANPHPTASPYSWRRRSAGNTTRDRAFHPSGRSGSLAGAWGTASQAKRSFVPNTPVIRFTGWNSFDASASYPEGNFGGNQLLDSWIGLSPLYSALAIDLHVRNASDLHQGFPAVRSRSQTTSVSTATTLIYASGAGITAAAGTRLALHSILVQGFKVYSFQLRGPVRGSQQYFSSLPPRAGSG
ncbi:hypothetical protein C7M84_018139 [Penaeus vannamei]|uniref:Uncharacterized protein n=1 Tax=Penaeus vannamei TaxID=6689 RepID=A0A3R7SJR9_PENVA|nr:hypothetical protein C7M84_018139 [Penaeus vannamei]